MKSKFFYNLIFLGILAFVLQSRSGGIGSKMNQDRTGSPISQGSGSYCASCHSGSSFAPSLSIKLFENGNEVTEYAPGVAYQLEVAVNSAQGNPDGYGMQTVVLDAANSAAGTFGTPPSGTRLSTVGGISYFEQSSINSSNTFMIDWVAPASGTGAVSIYAGGVAVNGDGGTSGDGAAKTSVMIPEATSTSLTAVGMDNFNALISPNPVAQTLQLSINSSTSENMKMQIFDANGSNVMQRFSAINDGPNTIRWDVAKLSSGIYFLRLQNDSGEVQMLKLLKQ